MLEVVRFPILINRSFIETASQLKAEIRNYLQILKNYLQYLKITNESYIISQKLIFKIVLKIPYNVYLTVFARTYLENLTCH